MALTDMDKREILELLKQAHGINDHKDHTISVLRTTTSVLQSEIERLSNALAVAKEDSKRLDLLEEVYLSENENPIDIFDDRFMPDCYRWPGLLSSPTLRLAIDSISEFIRKDVTP